MSDDLLKLEGTVECAGCDVAPEFAMRGSVEFLYSVMEQIGWQRSHGRIWCPKCASKPVRPLRARWAA